LGAEKGAATLLVLFKRTCGKERLASSSTATTWKSHSRWRVKPMAKNVNKIAKKLGAKVKGQVPDTGGGAFGMARLAENLTARLQPSQGLRPGRPSDPSWVLQGKVPMSEETKQQLAALAEKLSNGGRRVSPMQVAAQLLEESVSRYAGDV
jgi:hypothetical protein